MRDGDVFHHCEKPNTVALANPGTESSLSQSGRDVDVFSIAKLPNTVPLSNPGTESCLSQSGPAAFRSSIRTHVRLTTAPGLKVDHYRIGSSFSAFVLSSIDAWEN
eukprot:scaffold2637_cov153-Cylindrotheca_fusiformis.AAC.2